MARRDRPTQPPMPVLDDAARAIIEQLRQDGRRPYAAIGKAVGLSEAAVRQRVQRLIGTGTMRIVAVTDPLHVGFARRAMVGLGVDGDVAGVAEVLSEIDEVEYVVITAGRFDLLVEAVCEDDEHLLDLVTRQLRGVPGVRSTETFICLGRHERRADRGAR